MNPTGTTASILMKWERRQLTIPAQLQLIIVMTTMMDYPAIYIGYGDTATVNNYTGGRIEANYGEGVYIEYMNTATVNNYGRCNHSV